MKATLKNVAVALSILAMVMVVLVAVDNVSSTDVSATSTYVRVTVVDTNNNPVHNAKVTIGSATFNTDNKGLSPAIELTNLSNCYSSDITEWATTTVVVQKDGFVPAVVFSCVAYVGQTRKVTVKIYPTDSSDLPYVSYVESPPDDYVKTLINY